MERIEKVITMRMDEADKELIRQQSKFLGLDMASFCRTIVLQKIKVMKEENERIE